MRSDSDIKQEIDVALRSCPQIDARGISVIADGAVALLFGYVHDFSHKYIAEDIVKRVVGVAAIANDIQIRTPQSKANSDAGADPELAREAVAGLKRRLPLYSDRICPIVRQRIITLKGVVDDIDQRDEAERAAREVKGVVAVVNEIMLSPSTQSIRPESVRQLIEESFRRNGQQDAQDIRVETDATGVILRGHVRAWAERRQAEESAWSVPGVRSVRNELTVQFQA